MAKDYYDILGVKKGATQEEIKAAFRKAAHEHHPDKQGGSDVKFKELNEAYQTLGHADKRRQYDQFGKSAGGGGGAGHGAGAGGFNYQDFSRGGNPFGQQGGVNFDFGDLGDLGDIFGSFFGGGAGGGRPSRRATKGQDIEVELVIDFEESVFGVEKVLDLDKKNTCDRCQGSGGEPGKNVSKCNTCGGIGYVTRIQQTMLGNFQTQQVCPDCNGEGKKFDQRCQECHGLGVVHGSEKIKVKIPGGISDGQSIKLDGKGESIKGGKNGDLYIAVKVRASKIFERDGDDIYSEHHISIYQAIAGDKVEVETVDGPVVMKIPEGTQSNTKFKLSDKGVPHLRQHGRGDHIVTVVVDIPKRLGNKEKQILKDLKI
ncbi:MAG: molecular chaperone DnaJ [bacterium]